MHTLTIATILFLAHSTQAQLCGYIPNANTNPNYVTNPNFELGVGSWWAYDTLGWVRASAQDNGGCEIWSAYISTTCGRVAGLFQKVTLNQASPQPIEISGWSKAVNVSGIRNVDYSIYSDVTYTDGSFEFGLAAPFDTTGKWNKQSITFSPKKSIAYLYINLLFRYRTGAVFFDNVAVQLSSGQPTPTPTSTPTPTPNLLVNPSFDEPATSCTQIPGWSQVNVSYPFTVCGIIDYMRRSQPGAIAMSGYDVGDALIGAQQTVVLSQSSARELNITTWTWLTSCSQQTCWTGIKTFGVKLLLSFADGTNDSVEFAYFHGYSLTTYVSYSNTYKPPKPLRAVTLQLLFNGNGLGYVTWDDISLTQM